MTQINHMDLVTRRDLEVLARVDRGPCVSLLMPTHQAGPEMRQDPIRLKNLIGEAEDLLVESGLRAPEARELLEPARRLLDDHYFWRHQNHGLAAYLHPRGLRTFRVPLELDDLAVVGERFHLKPLLALLSEDGQFYVLALSQNSVRLLQGTRFTVSQVELEDVPESLDEALRWEDPERQVQFHTETRQRGDRRRAMFFGQGITGEETRKEEILRFFQQLDRGLHEVLRSEQVPLVLVGVDYLLPIYREANTYPHLLEAGVTGNPDERSPKDLHEAAWEMVEPVLRQARHEAAAEYERLLGTGKASSDLKEVMPSARHGRVAAVFVPLSTQVWGRFEADTEAVEVHDERRPGDEDLLDHVAVHTLLNGGSVYPVEAEEVPGEGIVAATFRY